jgi:hypothetical protein
MLWEEFTFERYIGSVFFKKLLLLLSASLFAKEHNNRTNIITAHSKRLVLIELNIFSILFAITQIKDSERLHYIFRKYKAG